MEHNTSGNKIEASRLGPETLVYVLNKQSNMCYRL